MAIKREDLKVGGEYVSPNYSKVMVTYIGRYNLVFEHRGYESFKGIEHFLNTHSKPKKKVKFDFYIHYYDDGKFLSSSSSMSAGIRGRIKIEHIEREIEVDDE